MEYNTQRNPLMIKEYGRNVQKLVEYAVAIKNKEERNEVALAIIKLMEQMNPYLKNVEEFNHKLWDHLLFISDFKLKIESPYPQLSKETYLPKPKPLPYKERYFHNETLNPAIIQCNGVRSRLKTYEN